MRKAALLIGCTCLLAASADARRHDPGGEAELAKALKGYVPGQQVSCITLRDADNQQVIDGTAILYRALGGKIYVNRPDGAQFLDDDNVQISKPFGDQLCRHDIIQQRDRYTFIPGGAIALNDFTVYTKVR